MHFALDSDAPTHPPTLLGSWENKMHCAQNGCEVERIQQRGVKIDAAAFATHGSDIEQRPVYSRAENRSGRIRMYRLELRPVGVSC